MAQADTVTTIKPMQGLKEPPMFKLIYLNDNATSMEFVVQSLIEFLGYTAETAVKITTDIHELGAATVAVLPYEIAEQKGVEITVSARSQNMPLQVRLEAENG